MWNISFDTKGNNLGDAVQCNVPFISSFNAQAGLEGTAQLGRWHAVQYNAPFISCATRH